MDVIAFLEYIMLATIHSFVGLLFGMSLVYTAKTSCKSRAVTAVTAVVLFYIAMFVLDDHALFRRLILIVVLGYVVSTGLLILRNHHRQHQQR